MFSSALAGYSRAAALDPGWEEPTEREKILLKYLDQITALMENKVSVVEMFHYDDYLKSIDFVTVFIVDDVRMP